MAYGHCAWSAEVTFTADQQAKCPEAVRELTDLRSRMPAPHASGIVTRPALRSNLLLMAEQDQAARAFFLASGGRVAPADAARMQAVDSANLKRLKHIVAQDGFPTAAMVGLDGVGAAWLLTVHAASDPGFQEEVLQLTREHVRRGEVRSDQVALLIDDVLKGRGKPQRYGTNLGLRDGELQPDPIEDEANVDERRRSVGLGTLANYVCLARVATTSVTPASR